MVTAPPEPAPPKPQDYRAKAAKLKFPAGKERVAVLFQTPSGTKTRFIPVKSGPDTARFSIPAVIKQGQRMGASEIVLIHNHPSGAEVASPEDLKVTWDLAKASRQGGMKLRDHLIYIGPGEVKSIKGQALLADISGHTRAHYRRVHARAKEIRRDGEAYSSALSRAWKQSKAEWDRGTGGGEGEMVPSTQPRPAKATTEPSERSPRRVPTEMGGSPFGKPLAKNQLVQFPSGRWGFRGEVDPRLAYVRPDGSEPTPRELDQRIRLGGRPGGLVTRTWATKAEATSLGRTGRGSG